MIKLNKPPIYGYEYKISMQEFEAIGQENEEKELSELIKGQKKSALKKSIKLAVRDKWLLRNGIISYKVVEDVAKSETIAIDDGRIDGYPSVKIRMYGYLGFPRTSEGAEESANVVVSDSVYCALYDSNGDALGYWRDITDFAEGGLNHKYFYSNKDEYENKTSKKDLFEFESHLKLCSVILDGKSGDASFENGAIYQAIERCSYSWGMNLLYFQTSKQEQKDVEKTLLETLERECSNFIIFCDKESIKSLDFLATRPLPVTLILLSTSLNADNFDLYKNYNNIYSLIIDSEELKIGGGKNRVFDGVKFNFIDSAFVDLGFADKLQPSKSPSAGPNLSKTLSKIYESVTKTGGEIYQIEIGKNNIKI